MAALSTQRHESANKDRHTRTGPVARWHLKCVNEAIYQMIARSGGCRVLDAGCGEGFVTSYLASRNDGLELTGIDTSEAAVAEARRCFGHQATFETGNVLELPYGDDSFDVVLCSEVLEHIPDWEKAISELRRVARSHVLITVPHEPYFKILNDLARMVKFCRDPGHVNYWSWRQFRDMIEPRFSSATFSRKHLIYQLALAYL